MSIQLQKKGIILFNISKTNNKPEMPEHRLSKIENTKGAAYWAPRLNIDTYVIQETHMGS